MQIVFYKYHGAGNDFIMIDNRSNSLPRYNPNLYAQWCHRRFGIGADGIILVQNHKTCDFEMVYYNADGHEGSMCGNGGRCVVAFAQQIGIVQKKMQEKIFFWAADGMHYAFLNPQISEVSLQMNQVNQISQQGTDWVLNTGSPHYVRFVNNLAAIDVFAEGSAIRYNPTFAKNGINVNFVEINPTNPFLLRVATYERGVEAETYACGTGVVAACIATAYSNTQLNHKNKNNNNPMYFYQTETKGGKLSVGFRANTSAPLFSDIWLTGNAVCVFRGELNQTDL